MSLNISDIMKNAGKPASALTMSENLPELIHRGGSPDGMYAFSSSPPMPMVTDDNAPDLIDPKFKATVAADLSSVYKADLIAFTTAVDPEDPSRFKHPQYYAQRGGKTSFRYMNSINGIVSTAVFYNGVLVTYERSLVAALDADIKRVGGIGGDIAKVSEQHYLEIMSRADVWHKIRGQAGSTGSVAADPIAASKAAKLASLESQVEAQADKIRELQAQLEAK